MVEVFGVVQDPLAGVAGDDLIVFADVLKHLGPYSDFADFTNLISRRTNADSAAMFSNPVVRGNKIRGQSGSNLLALFQIRIKRTEIALVFLLKLFSLGMDLLLILFQNRFRCFQVG